MSRLCFYAGDLIRRGHGSDVDEGELREIQSRDGLRYPSDLTDAEWGLVEPLIPPAKHGGRRHEVDVREVLNGLPYSSATLRQML